MQRLRIAIASVVFVLLMLGFWLAACHQAITFPEISIGRALISFALLFSPLWFFGFGAAEPLKRIPVWARVTCPAVLEVPYLALTAGTPDFYWRDAIIVMAFPVLLSAFLEFPNLPAKATTRDAAALAIIGGAYFMHWLQAAWPLPGAALFPKLFLADIALYCFLVIRKLEGSGFCLVPSKSSLRIGLREWLLYLPIALALGELTGFIHFHRALPNIVVVGSSVLFTAFLIALPEEMFFRAIIQNILEGLLGKSPALLLAAVLFGLSHFNHGSAFNWRYVVLATVAGIFYGRAWRAQRQIVPAIVTHTLVDVVWSLWFR